ncbi:hypothetical protein [Spirosoma foliorum]|uniref:Uncharacterized protein n=1 Tax=Spirosoma foliorum TaxID=2710596 RepID=A0A7G5GXQ3_9BACT|nr:hypothetical protein [Spirosoma foliorum]QMW03645.1 hypothetical protein H3H32_01385 [Spirosoma foliorum]
MITALNLFKSLDWTIHTIRFIKNHFWVIFGLGLIAAFGRAIQLRAFGPISPLSHTLLEVVVESARVLIFVYALGLTNVKTGVLRLVQLVTNKQSRKQNWRVAVQKVKDKWPSLLINLIVFSVIALLFNKLINHIAYETCLYITLQARQVISSQSSEWALILFFKNISVIPFTLIFNALFCLWLVNRLPKQMAYS